ncbi:16S rRNA (cytosine(1402)-N(4))-methyltransferase, partial [bacterium]|nr:16S rRNA (cytosine(1402)-N(4))-methyltransferase [bacterium]
MFHEPVLLDEVVELLVTDRRGVYVDCTVGGGGHSEAILVKLKPSGQLIGFDLDGEAIQAVRKRLRAHKNRVIVIQGNFKDMGKHLEGLGFDQVTGVLLDLGLSSHQIDTPQRGFSFDRPGKLDMRMDQRKSLTAEKILHSYSR